LKNDIQKYVNYLFELQNLSKDMKEEDKIKIRKYVYEMETFFFEIIEKEELPMLDNRIRSNSVLESFDNFLGRKKEITVFRSIDYQYYFLLYIFKNQNKINESNLLENEVIHDFINHIKEESFTFLDIERTDSGATRCNTNLRFAIDSLRTIGLINSTKSEVSSSAIEDPRSAQLSKQGKKLSVTFLGMFVAISILLSPDERRMNPFASKLNIVQHKDKIRKYDEFLIRRMQTLLERKYIEEIFASIKLNVIEYDIFINEMISFMEDYIIVLNAYIRHEKNTNLDEINAKVMKLQSNKSFVNTTKEILEKANALIERKFRS
jgi:hypothetical protein